MTGNTCSTCRCWDGIYCRRRSPRVIPVDRVFTPHESVWPTTKAGDWCGEHILLPAKSENLVRQPRKGA